MSNTNQNSYSVEIDYKNDQVNYYDHSGNYIADTSQLLGKGTLDFFSDFKNTTVGEYSKLGGKLLFGVENGYKFTEYLTQQSGTSGADGRDFFVAGSQTAVRVAATDGTSWVAGGASAAAALALMPAAAGLSALIIVPGIIGAGVKVTTSYFSGKKYDSSNMPDIIAENAGKIYDSFSTDSSDNTIIGITGEKNSQSKFKVTTKDNACFIETDKPLSDLETIDFLKDFTNGLDSELERPFELSINEEERVLSKGNNEKITDDKNLFPKDSKLVDKDGSEVSPESAISVTKDKNGEDVTIAKSDVNAEAPDGTIAPLTSIINMKNSMVNATEKFMEGYVHHFQSLFSTAEGQASLINDINAGIQKGEEPEQIARTIATKLAVKQLADQIKNNLILEGADQAIYDQYGLDAIYGSGENQISQEGKDAINNFATDHPVYSGLYIAAISMATSILLNHDEGWNSEEYTRAAVESTAQAAAQVAVAHYFGSSAGAAGVGAAAAYVVSAAVNDLFADDGMNSHQWQSTMVSAAVVGVAAAIGFALGGPIGAAIAGVIVGQFMGGKEFKDGEYPDPYSFLQIEAKEDGTGNIIYGVEKEGVVAIAREYYHDDIYGTNGNDILVGKSGTNLLVGRGGNDLLEGRGDTDQIYGGDGDDIIEAGGENDYVQGDAGNDLIYGDGGDDVILGGDDNDIIYGGEGSDRIEGENGDDIIKGEKGEDVIVAGAGNDNIEGGDDNDTIFGEDGNDEIDGGIGNDTIDGGAGIDILVGGEGNDNIRGGDDNDEIYGSSGSDILYGDYGSDIVNGGDDNDLIFGGIGNDIVYGGSGDDSVYGEIGNDYVIGGGGNDTVDGFDGDDVLFAGKGNDTLDGGSGLDTFIFRSGDGQDTITDSDGTNDVIKFSDINSSQVTLTKDSNNLVITFTDTNGNPTTDQITITNQLLSNNVIETLEFADGKKIDLTSITTNADNTVNYSLEDYYNVDTAIQSGLIQEYAEELDIDARDQVNTDSTWYDSNFDSQDKQEIENEHYNEVQWKSYKAKRNAFGGHYTKWYKYYEKNLQGTDGNDRIVGNWWNENIYGEGGDDQLYGNNGDDIIYGQDGNDYINGGADNDTIYGGNGFDKLEGGTGNDEIYGGNQNDTIFGQWGDDTIYGNNHDDFIDGGQGNDIISGDIDPTTLNELKQELENLKSIPNYILNNDKLARFLGLLGEVPTSQKITSLEELVNNLESGNDIILGGDGNDTITGEEGNDLVIGNDGNDNLLGGDGNDTIYGRSGSDVIEAGAGDDYVSGGDDYDTINGNDGNDILYGNGGVDVIYGNDGNDYIYGGSGNDQLFGNLGDDYIYGGSGTNIIEGNEGNDTITGGEDYDRIEGGEGNDTIFGRSGGDELYGGSGDDIISAGQGNDILIDGTGNDNLIGGADNDIFILSKNDETIDSDVIEDFDKNEDKIIIKVDYKNPITFTTLQSLMSQNGSDVEINFASGQKITIKNNILSDLTEDNIAIGLAGGENNDILFGTISDDILFGEGGNDQIYGGDGNDQLWGGKGADSLYGENGSDILRYEIDGTFLSDTSTSLVGYTPDSAYGHFSWNGANVYLPTNDQRNYYSDYDIAYKHDDSVESSRRWVDTWTEKHSRWNGKGWGSYHTYHAAARYDNSYEIRHYFTKNFYNSEDVNINGYNRSFDSFDGGDGSDVLLMTDGDDMLTLDDAISSNSNPGEARVKNMSVIYANDGNDIINFTSPKYTHDDIIIYSGNGNDRVWSSIGNDTLFGQSGDDEIYGASGNDFISGGIGDDTLVGGDGNDTIEGGNGNDVISGGAGDDLIEGGSGADILDGGEGNDTISYATSTSGVTVNIADNIANGGDATGDTISNFENITGSAFVDNLTGDENNNIIEGGAGDDILTGGGGSDTYIWNIGDGNDTITDGINNHGDVITFGSAVSKNDLVFEKSDDGKDLIIKIKGNDKDSLTVKDQLTNDGSRIEEIAFSNGVDTNINLENKTIVSNEDEIIEINLDEIEQERVLNQNIALIAAFGSAIYNEDTGLITYNPNSNFNGIEELSYNITDDEGNVIRTNSINLLLSPINDNPFGQIGNQEIIVDEQFNLNLNDFFSDLDGDSLTYLVNAKNQIGLPHFLNLNEETGELSGIFGRSGKLTIEVSVSDGNGGIFSTSFDIRSNMDLSQRVVDLPDIEIINGSDGNDVIKAKFGEQNFISAGSGNDIINYEQDGTWQDTGNETFFAWNVYSGDKVSIAGKLQSFDSFDGGIGDDELTLTDGNDVLFLDDPVTSTLSNSARISGIEVINGGLGDDIIDLTSLNFEYGDVVLNGGDGDDVLWSNSGDDILNGGDGNDNLQAGTGNDILNGDAGDDILKGYDGDETLTGGTGADTLTGGFGFDSFNFTALNESTINNSDLITDFTQGEDSINFSNLGFTAIQAGEGSGTVLGYSYDGESDITTIEDANSDFAIQLSGKIDLTNDDFNF